MKRNKSMIRAIALCVRIRKELDTLQQDFQALLHAVGESVSEWNEMATENALLRVKTEFQQHSNNVPTECEQRSNNVGTEFKQSENNERTTFKHNTNKHKRKWNR